MSRRAIETLAALLVVGAVLSGLSGAACVLGPKQDDPDIVRVGDDAGSGADSAAAGPDTSFLADTGTGSADAASDAAVPPPDNKCGDDLDAGDARDADAPEGGCDAGVDADAHDGDAPGDGVTGG